MKLLQIIILHAVGIALSIAFILGIIWLIVKMLQGMGVLANG